MEKLACGNCGHWRKVKLSRYNFSGPDQFGACYRIDTIDFPDDVSQEKAFLTAEATTHKPSGEMQYGVTTLITRQDFQCSEHQPK